MTDTMIGDPETQANFIEQQLFNDNCAVCAETSIINQFLPDGQLSQEEAAYISAQNGWYVPGEGTSPDFVGNLMDVFHIDNHTVSNASIEQLASELEQGHGVIVGVRSDQLWDEGPMSNMVNYICKACGLDNSHWQPADHAICVTGMKIDDNGEHVVFVNDSGIPNGEMVEYPLDKFLDAWQNSDFQYTATDSPLPSLVQAGIENDSFWNGFDWSTFMPTIGGIATGLLTGLFTGDLTTGLTVGGLVSSNLRQDLFGNEDFARMI